MKFNPLNIEEIAVGIFVELPFYFLIGLLVIPLAIICGLLWALGGAGCPPIRRFGVPTVTCLFLMYFWTWKIWFAYPFAVLAVSMGYGEKSWLWVAIYAFTQDHKLSDFITRLTTYFLYWLSFIVCLLLINRF